MKTIKEKDYFAEAIKNSTERLIKENGHIVVLENYGGSVHISNYGSRDTLLNYLILDNHGMQITVREMKHILSLYNGRNILNG